MKTIFSIKSGIGFLIMMITVSQGSLIAQEEKRLLRKGTNSYQGGKYLESEQYFSQALSKKQGYLRATYNLGNSKFIF
jgi:hypothetical protein